MNFMSCIEKLIKINKNENNPSERIITNMNNSINVNMNASTKIDVDMNINLKTYQYRYECQYKRE